MRACARVCAWGSMAARARQETMTHSRHHLTGTTAVSSLTDTDNINNNDIHNQHNTPAPSPPAPRQALPHDRTQKPAALPQLEFKLILFHFVLLPFLYI